MYTYIIIINNGGEAVSYFVITILYVFVNYNYFALGFENHDSGVGIYAPDAAAYTVFAPIFDPIIEDYHKGFTSTDKHPDKNWGDVNTLGDLDPEVTVRRRNMKQILMNYTNFSYYISAG